MTSSLESTNGAHEGNEDVVPGSESLDADQTLADRDQTLADADQTRSDIDQTTADEGDQLAADRDQAASDRDLAHGADPAEHARARELRERNTERRRHTAEERARAAAERDAVADSRDRAAAARDEAAARHDRELAARDAAWSDDADTEIRARAARNRERAAADRTAAAEGRARAAADREQATRDRKQAARDRLEGQADREALLHQLAISETDGLTGARIRTAGLADLEREMNRARRTTGLLTVAYIDAVGLKEVNDTRGHAAGDAMLQAIVRAIHGQLRSYDSVVRLGGDEFLCVMSGATIEDARDRFGAIHAVLGADLPPHEIRVGFASLERDESAAELIDRADRDMPTSRSR